VKARVERFLAARPGAHDLFSRHPNEVGDDVIELHAHLRQRLLYVLNMLRLISAFFSAKRDSVSNVSWTR
jgi:hypothetical protein